MTADVSQMLTERDLDDFLNKHGDSIFTYLCVLCRNEDDASEAMQNAYVKFLTQVRLGKVRFETAAQYLLTIAKNDFFAAKRKESREVSLPDEISDGAGDARRSKDETVQELRLLLLETMGDPNLPDDVRAIIRLRFLEEASIESICKDTGKSQATVYRLMEKALTALAESCKRAGLKWEDFTHE